jgi:hypothetical protein
VPAAIKGGVKEEAIKPASFSGNAQTQESEARSESWFWVPALDGIAGAGCESDDGAGAQQLILPPQEQQECTGCCAHAGIGAAGNCAHTSSTSSELNKMANNREPFVNP